tara:strand:+ start:845 stop:1948 length:1104 start_codon:yes stop_codon:yes gene_type:complete
MQYWKTHQKDIIYQKLNLVLKKSPKLTVWQQFGSHRYTHSGKLHEVSEQICRLHIDTESQHYDKLDIDKPIFVHIPGIEIIFKKDKYNRHGHVIEFSIPGDIQVYERRKNQRFYYLYQDHKSITFHSEMRDVETDKPEFVFTSVLVDISIAGAGMVVGNEEVQKLKVGSEVFLVNLTDQTLPKPFRVKVKYIEPYKHNDLDLHKVGLIFDDQLDSISYKSISSIVEKKQRKTQGLNPEQYCGMDFEEQVRAINIIEMKNPVLANNLKDNIEYLDQLRYMTTKMKVEFLKNTNQDLLAVALRMSSKELVYDLFSEVTQTMQEEFLDKLKNEKPASAVCKAQDDLIKDIRQMVASGEIVLDPTAFVTYV